LSFIYNPSLPNSDITLFYSLWQRVTREEVKSSPATMPRPPPRRQPQPVHTLTCVKFYM